MTMQPPSGDDLDALIADCRAYLRDHPGDPGTLADLVGALLGRADRAAEAGDLGAVPVDVAAAVEAARGGLATAASDDPELLEALRGRLGLALQRRFYLWLEAGEQDPAGLERARADWIEAVTLVGDMLSALLDEDPEDPELTEEIEIFSRFLGLAVLVDPLGADGSDAFVTWVSWLFDRAAAALPHGLAVRDELDLRVLLAGELDERVASGVGDRRASLEAIVAHLEAVFPLIPADDGEGTLAEVLVELTRRCWQLTGGDTTQYAALDRMVRHARQAWGVLDADHEDRAEIGAILAAALHEQSIRPGAPPVTVETLNMSITVLTETVSRLATAAAEDHDGYSTEAYLGLKVLLGTAIATRAQLLGGQDDLAIAARILSEAAAELAPHGSRWPGIAENLALALAGLAHTGMLTGSFDPAIDLLRVAVGQNPAGERGAYLRGTLGLALLGRSADEHGAIRREGVEHLRAAHDLAPAGSSTRIWAAMNLGSHLAGEHSRTGDRQQLRAARFYLDAAEQDLLGRGAGDRQRPGVRAIDLPNLEATLAMNRGLLNMAEAAAGDTAKAEAGISAFRLALDLLPPGHSLAAQGRCDLALARLMQASSRDPEGGGSPALRAAADDLDAAARALPTGHLMQSRARLRAAGALAANGLRARDPGEMRAAVDRLTDLRREAKPRSEVLVRCTGLLGFTCAELYGLTSHAADLDAALAWLELAVAEFERVPGHPHHAETLARLAHLHRDSGQAKAAIPVGLSALRTRVGDVLLQSGTAHGLAAARVSAAEAAEIAGWCLAAGEPERAVEALELGRGLVLYAATAVTTLPDLLAAEGLVDLAGEWRDQAKDVEDAMPWEGGGDPGYFASLLAGAPLQAPSDLRRRTLEGLAGYARDRLLAPPRTGDVARALGRTGADALVYLLPPDGSLPGRALVVPADGSGPREVPLPALTAPATELDEYLAAHEALLADQDPGDDVLRRRHDALAGLCEWAGPAVIEPVLGARPGELPRIVLVPSGQLSMVPWHAARVRAAGAARGGDGAAAPADGERRYAVEVAVFSYAASARQLVEVSQRAALPLSSSPVILADPTASMSAAKLEARPLAERFYPGARYLGPDDQAAGRGTPDEVLAALPSAGGAGASMLHLACHANVADGAPDRSYFELADGHLTVESILRRGGGRPAGAAGGLIDLVACRSDLAAAHYDEALTLATAFLAAGARTVVGARWEIQVRQSSVLAYMFHRFLVGDGLGPRDALRRAQLWMLDQSRAVPDDMPPELANKARTGALAHPMFWAAITHQGW